MILIPSDPAVTPYTEDLTPPARALDSIRVGQRQRADLRDFDVLAASVDREGLLQPITIAWDGVPCGPRRLAAMLQRRRKTANVWAWSGVSDELGQLLAEQDDNDLYKPLTQTEQAALRREPNTLLADDAARNQEAFRLTATGDSTRSDGGATVAPPSAANGEDAGTGRTHGHRTKLARS
jgi:ParB family chromosome partitioning protein